MISEIVASGAGAKLSIVKKNQRLACGHFAVRMKETAEKRLSERTGMRLGSGGARV